MICSSHLKSVSAISLSALVLATGAVAALVTTARAADPTSAPDAVHLHLLSSGASKLTRFYVPQKLTLSDTKPDSIKQLPPGLTHASYAVIQIAGIEGATYHLVLDEPQDAPCRLFVDANGDGDLTNDAPADWTGQPAQRMENGKVVPALDADGKPLKMYQGGATLHLGTADAPYDVRLAMYRFDPRDPERAQLSRNLFYYGDYNVNGEITLAGKTYKAALLDLSTTGDFRSGPDPQNGAAGVKLFIDRNGNGQVDASFELYDPRKPFNIGGVTYELADLAKDGLSFRIINSSKTVAERPAAPDVRSGKPALAFQAKTVDGQDIQFPSAFKGKLVMLDFWATWCGPCMQEVPGLVKAYNQLHASGFEVLGVSLDQPDTLDKVKSTTAEKGMVWPEIYDGKAWEVALVKRYGVESIPASFLVDGDTGVILASGNDLRGESLLPTLQKALAKKSAK